MGHFTGSSGGYDTVYYTVTNVCGTVQASKRILVFTQPTISLVTSDTVLCVGSTTGYINYSATAGSPATYSIVWDTAAITAGFTNVTNSSLPASPITYAIPATVAAATYTATLYVKNTTCTSVGYPITVTINALPTITLGTIPSVVQGTASTTLPYTATTGAPYNYSILWTGTAPGQGFTNLSIVSLPASPITIAVPAAAVAGTYSGIFVASNAYCGSPGYTINVTITPSNRAPVFVNGASQSISLCENISSYNIDTLLSVRDSDISQTETWTVNTTPAHGTLGGFAATTLSTGGVVLPSGLTYTPTTGYSGLDSFKVKISDGTANTITTIHITVNPLPDAGAISGSSSVCVGSSITLTETASPGTWGASNSHATVDASGVVHGVSTGTVTISFTTTNACGSSVATKVVSVNSTGSAGTITGASSVCTGSTITLADTAAGGTGLWTVTNSHASVSSSGVVTGLSTGIDTVVYTISTTCGSSSTSTPISVITIPAAGLIFGSSNVCAGAVITLTDTVSGGVWSAGNSNATVSGGVVTAVTAGIDTIRYTVSNSCGFTSAAKNVTIHPAASAGAITGGSSVCMGSTLNLSDTATGGTWGSSNGNAIVTAGVVTPITPGTDTITYTTSNSCGSATASVVITINALPNAGNISGASSVCAFSSITLIDTAVGGNWTDFIDLSQ